MAIALKYTCNFKKSGMLSENFSFLLIVMFQNVDDDKGSDNKKKSSIFASFKDKLTKSGKFVL